MPKRLTNEEFIKRCKERKGYEPLSEYVNNSTPVRFRHIECGRVFSMKPAKFFSGQGCVKCSKKKMGAKFSAENRKKFTEMLEKLELEIADRNYSYRSRTDIVHVRCKKCGREQHSYSGNILKGHGCAHCSGVACQKHYSIVETLAKKAPDWEIIGEYTNAKTATLFRHKKCGKTFYRIPDTVLRQPNSCRHCNTSKGEAAVCDFILDILGEESKSVICNGRGLLHGKELDIYIPTRKLAIEYDGLYYHSYEKLKKKEDKLGIPAQAYNEWKTEECLKRGVRLIHIFEDEWLEKQNIVEDKLKAVLRVPAKRYYARKLTIKTIPRTIADAFYDNNHIQGSTNVTVSIGLYDKEELLAVQSFLPYTRREMSNTWELARYATKLGTQVVGGFSRCLKWFERQYDPNEVISFADKRWCDQFSNVYETTGFVREGDVPRNYWYIQGQKRYHKFGFRKAKFKSKYPEVYSPNKTEAQMAEEIGLHRIYDCGLIRYSKKY